MNESTLNHLKPYLSNVLIWHISIVGSSSHDYCKRLSETKHSIRKSDIKGFKQRNWGITWRRIIWSVSIKRKLDRVTWPPQHGKERVLWNEREMGKEKLRFSWLPMCRLIIIVLQTLWMNTNIHSWRGIKKKT